MLTLSWLTPTLDEGTRVPLRNLPPLPEADNTVYHGAAFVHAIGDKNAVIRSMVWQWRWPLALLQVGFILQHVIGLASPLILKRILVFQEANNNPGTSAGSAAVTTGIFAIQLYVAVEIVRIFLGSQVGWGKSRLHLRMHAALTSLVLDRSLHRHGADQGAGKSGSASDGGIYNVLAADVGVHVEALFTIMHAWLWPFTMTAAAFLLYREIGAAAYPGVVAMCLLQLAYLAMQSVNAGLRGPYLAAKDVRIGRLSETLQNIRSVRVNAWRDAMGDHVSRGRAREMGYLSVREYLESTTGALQYAHATIVTLVVFYYFLGNPTQSFKASLVLPVIGMLAQVNGPIGSVPNWVRVYIEYRNGSGRLQEYLTITTRERAADDAPVEHLVASNAEFRHGDSLNGDEETLLPGFTLRATLHVAVGEVVILTGPTGSGKSMLLSSLLGEVPLLRGVVRAPKQGPRGTTTPPAAVTAHGLHTGTPVNYPQATVAYCPQVPWVFPGTVEANILFGARKDEALYTRVVEACALADDVATFPQGDQTEVR
jgi:ABC-type multidrug transport system fused ATPase/permease subunit